MGGSAYKYWYACDIVFSINTIKEHTQERVLQY